VQVVGAEGDDVVILCHLQRVQGAAVGGVAVLEADGDVRQAVAIADGGHGLLFHLAEHLDRRARGDVGVQLADDDRGAAVPTEDEGVFGARGRDGGRPGAHGAGVQPELILARKDDRIIIFRDDDELVAGLDDVIHGRIHLGALGNLLIGIEEAHDG
jgi:hypothetical protein